MGQHDHDHLHCQCHKRAPPAVQSLDELDFLKSACSAAQKGNVIKLRSLLQRHPHFVHDDGVGGDTSEALHHWARCSLCARLDFAKSVCAVSLQNIQVHGIYKDIVVDKQVTVATLLCTMHQEQVMLTQCSSC